MSRFYFKMPIKKSLSYAFARVSNADVLCTNIVCRVGKGPSHGQQRGAPTLAARLGLDKRYSFIWYEMRPMEKNSEIYVIEVFSYSRNSLNGFKSETTFSHRRHRKARINNKSRYGIHFSRYEAIAELKALEKNLIEREGYQLVDNTPSSMKALSVHKAPFYGR